MALPATLDLDLDDPALVAIGRCRERRAPVPDLPEAARNGARLAHRLDAASDAYAVGLAVLGAWEAGPDAGRFDAAVDALRVALDALRRGRPGCR